ncbi:MAG: NAD-dependent protein deacylase [Lachnospiraceae bacterium]|nr:NAD-dependent protein deacylase [Lachnospiraceae bacterium]
MDEKQELLSRFNEMIKTSKSIVFFGGAGVSTESGIPDFRSVDGLYNQKYDYPPETILSHTFFIKRPSEFYRFYRDKILIDGVEPNTTHIKLAELEKAGKLKAIVTQNIDGLHQKAGSKEVYEVHGTVAKNHCTKCNKFFTGDEVKDLIDASLAEGADKNSRYLPICPDCGGLIKPDVVLYEEGLDDYIWNRSVDYIQNADMLIVGGTSLVVYPAAGLVNYYRGSKLVLINKSTTPFDDEADLVLHMGLGEVFGQVTV